MQSNNPMGTEGFEFLEFSTPDPEKLGKEFESMGFVPVAKHRTKNITLYQQNQIRFLINAEPNSHAAEFAKLHGPSVCGMAFRVKDAQHAYQRTVKLAARTYTEDKALGLPTIYGIGDSLLYLVDEINANQLYNKDFVWTEKSPDVKGAGLVYIDHVTHNVYRGQMEKWAEFYERLFNFREIRYFDIKGKLTGLTSRALTSPCGKIRIPINESSDDKSQIEEYLQQYKGEGIQHIAVGTADIYHTVEKLNSKGIKFLFTPDTYYQGVDKRLPEHAEDLPRLQKNRIIIDGTTKGGRKLLLQIFTENMIGPVFFEIIQRKGDEGFGEGNFQALFEAMELDQIERGVLKAE